MNQEDLMESITETLWNKGPECATEPKTNHFKNMGEKQKKNPQMDETTHKSIHREEGKLCLYLELMNRCL